MGSAGGLRRRWRLNLLDTSPGTLLRTGIYESAAVAGQWTWNLRCPPVKRPWRKALLLGLRAELPEEVVEDFRASGTSHLLAISGLHLGILLLMALGLLQWALGRHTSTPILLALALVWLYVAVSGAPASVVRAAIMGSVYLAALGLGRPRESLLPALAFSVLVMTALDPRVVSPNFLPAKLRRYGGNRPGLALAGSGLPTYRQSL